MPEARAVSPTEAEAEAFYDAVTGLPFQLEPYRAGALPYTLSHLDLALLCSAKPPAHDREVSINTGLVCSLRLCLR